MADKRPVLRDELGKVVPGSGSLNPGGRPMGVARLVRELSHDGQGRESVQFLYAVMRGEVPEEMAEVWRPFGELPDVKTRAGAALKLWEKETGKAPLSVRLHEAETDADDLRALSDEELGQLLVEQVKANPALRSKVLDSLAHPTEQ